MKSRRFVLFYRAALLGGGIFFSWYLFWTVAHPQLPSSHQPLIFYSNQTSDDFKILFKRAIESSTSSIFLQVYGFTDPHLLLEVSKAAQKGVHVKLFYDPSASPPLHQSLPFAYPLACRGLMHKKILIVDHQNVFIGSANFTPTSLRMHDNLVAGIHQKDLARFIESSLENRFFFSIGKQKAEFWHLPDFQHQCLSRILASIEKASSSIHLALFTFTHPKILEALVAAKQRGVDVQIAIDFYSARGSGKKTIERLKQEGISLWISPGGKLLHYKWALIDGTTLFLGSANWTKSAFQNNEDCLLVLEDLSDQQKKYFSSIWKQIQKNSLL